MRYLCLQEKWLAVMDNETDRNSDILIYGAADQWKPTFRNELLQTIMFALQGDLSDW
jgi:hypothetical protein